MKVHRCLIIVYHFKFHLMSVFSSFAQNTLILFHAQWKVLDDLSFGTTSNTVHSLHNRCFCLWEDSNLCFLIVCISPCFTAQKKLPLTSLSQAMVEGGNQLGEDSLIGWVCDVSPEKHVANGSRCNPKGTHRQSVQLSVSFMTSL